MIQIMNSEKMIVNMDAFTGAAVLIAALRKAKRKCNVSFRMDAMLRRHEYDTKYPLNRKSETIDLAVVYPEDYGLVYDARPQYVWERVRKGSGLIPCPIMTAPYFFLQHNNKLQKDENIHIISTSEDSNDVLSVSIMYNFESWFLCVMELGEYRHRNGPQGIKRNKFIFAIP